MPAKLRLISAIILLLGPIIASGLHHAFAWTHGKSVSCPDAPPTLAAGFGFNTCTFFDPMTSLTTVDVNATNAAPSTGINWYTEMVFGISSFTGTISGTALTSVSYLGASQQNLAVGMTLGFGGDTCTPTPGTTIVSGSGTTWVVSPSQSTCTGTIAASFAQAPNTISVAPTTGLTLTNVSQGNSNYGLGTAAFLSTPSSPTVQPYRGTTFANGFLARSYFTLDETLAPAGQAGCSAGTCWRWPAWWMVSFAGQASGSHYIETDNCDCFSNNGSVQLNNFLHDNGCGVSCSGGNIFSDNFGQPPVRSVECNPVLDGNTFHTFDQLWVPPSKNGGTGFYGYSVDADTCPGNAIFTGAVSGTVLTATCPCHGTLAVGSIIGNNGTTGERTISSFGTGTGGAGTYNLNFTGGTVASSLMIATNANVCAYFALGSGRQSTCTSTPYDGAFAIADSSNGFFLIFNGGCTNSIPQNSGVSTGCNAGTSAGNWPFKIKNVQVWQTQMSDKKVQN